MWLIQTQLWMGQYVDSGQLLDLRPYIESGALDTTNIPEANLESGRAADGGIYAVAAGLNTPCIQYNQTLLEEHGIEIKNGMTVDEFAAKCAEIYEKTGYKTIINNPESFIEYLLRADGKLLYDEGKIGADSPEDLITYFNLMQKGRDEGWLIDYETYVTAGGDSATQPVVTGEAWNAMWNSNQTAALQSPCPEGVVLGMVTWPTSNLDASGYTAGAMPIPNTRMRPWPCWTGGLTPPKSMKLSWENWECLQIPLLQNTLSLCWTRRTPGHLNIS